MSDQYMPAVKDLSVSMDTKCTRCGVCRDQCAFLKQYGTPGEIARKVGKLPQTEWPDPYECSLCGLCNAVCPEGLQPEALFLDMRRVRAEAGALDLGRYKPVLSYEKLGDSDFFSLLRFSEKGGDTVLFPGCALPASRSETVRRLFLALQKIVPDIGIALGCCLKPSHDLGRVKFFEERFGRLHEKLTRAGVKRVVTACPNCQKIFSMYGGSIAAVTAYTLLAESGFTPAAPDDGEAVIHDPCPQRYDRGTQDAMRSLTGACNIRVIEIKEGRENTRCCGEGGMVKFVRPEFADIWTALRRKAADGRRMVTSCAGCANFLGGPVKVDHILDLLFDSRRRKPLKPPLTCLYRLWLKRWFKKRLG